MLDVRISMSLGARVLERKCCIRAQSRHVTRNIEKGLFYEVVGHLWHQKRLVELRGYCFGQGQLGLDKLA